MWVWRHDCLSIHLFYLATFLAATLSARCTTPDCRFRALACASAPKTQDHLKTCIESLDSIWVRWVPARISIFELYRIVGCITFHVRAYNFDCGIQCKWVCAIYALRILVSSQPFAIEICNSGLLVHTRAGLACCGLLSRVAAKAVCLGSKLMWVALTFQRRFIFQLFWQRPFIAKDGLFSRFICTPFFHLFSPVSTSLLYSRSLGRNFVGF